MLSDESHGVGQQIQRYSQPAARCAHHGLVLLERIVMLVED